MVFNFEGKDVEERVGAGGGGGVKVGYGQDTN